MRIRNMQTRRLAVLVTVPALLATTLSTKPDEVTEGKSDS